jgi:predicted site-specific integrase-resolvase
VPIKVNEQIYYTSLETCEKTGISRATLSRWLRQGIIKELHKDRRGWRLFTEDDLNKIEAETSRIEVKKLT